VAYKVQALMTKQVVHTVYHILCTGCVICTARAGNALRDVVTHLGQNERKNATKMEGLFLNTDFGI
jgi:Na+-translocating ferredoxin:NAD+ oxidoreductase RNF subunit RnfB